jgi:4-hydroxy-3-methylbut-2-en-1-yl diphosphate synthase IspG/GcpE
VTAALTVDPLSCPRCGRVKLTVHARLCRACHKADRRAAKPLKQSVIDVVVAEATPDSQPPKCKRADYVVSCGHCGSVLGGRERCPKCGMWA